MPKDSLLWSVHKDESRKAFVFGTVHLLQDEINPIIESVSPFLDLCDAYYAEVNLEALLTEDISTFFTLKDNQKIIDYLRPQQWLKMQKLCNKHFGIDLSEMERMLPLFILHQLQISLLPSPNMESVDSILWNKAITGNKFCDGIEDLKAHFGTLQKIPLKFQYKSLKDAFRHIVKFKQAHKKILYLYNKQDIRQIYKLSRKMLGPYRRVMLMDRNILMYDAMIEAMIHKTPFFALGAGHLYGKEGVLALLKKKGYKVLPVSLQHTA